MEFVEEPVGVEELSGGWSVSEGAKEDGRGGTHDSRQLPLAPRTNTPKPSAPPSHSSRTKERTHDEEPRPAPQDERPEGEGEGHEAGCAVEEEAEALGLDVAEGDEGVLPSERRER